MEKNSKEINEIFPDDKELREKLFRRSSILNYIGWSVSFIAIIYVIILWNDFQVLVKLMEEEWG